MLLNLYEKWNYTQHVNIKPQLKIVKAKIQWAESFLQALFFLLVLLYYTSTPWYYGLTHFMPLVSFYTPWEYQKTRGFLIFSGVIERDHWHEIGKLFDKSWPKKLTATLPAKIICRKNNLIRVIIFSLLRQTSRKKYI